MSGVVEAFEADQIVSTLFRRNARSCAPESRPMGVRMIILLLLCTLISQIGCILLPLPSQERKVLAGTPVTEEQLAFLAPNVTTKSEVIARLSRPDVIWEEARLFAYNWIVQQGILVWAVYGVYSVGAGSVDVPERHMLLIQFDDQDRVLRFERAVRPLHKSYGDFLKEWVADSDRSHPKE